MITKLFLLTILLASQSMYAQQTVSTMLSSIEQNNLMLKTNSQYWQVRNTEYRTGLTPADPTVGFDYMVGTPVGAGNQRDFTVTQQFDFPTAYVKRRQLSSRQIEQSQWQHIAYRQELLFQAKQTMIRLIYQNRRRNELLRRLSAIEKLVADYQTKLDKGDGNILDVNKAKLQLLSIKNEVKQNYTEINSLLIKLAEYNGGNTISFNDTTYPFYAVGSDFETLYASIKASDPLVKIYEFNRDISAGKVGLQRSLGLPKPEVGYHSQGILGQSYKGVHIGASIPLWENRNRIRTEKANLSHSELQLSSYKIEHRNENRQLYEQYTGRKAALEEYKNLLGTVNNVLLLDKALRLGQMSTIEYFMELSYYYNAYDKYLEIEYEFQKATTALYKFQL